MLLRWQWEARAAFGPVEHRITIENLSGQEIWLPMVDSLRLDWRTPRGTALRHLYVEKGADTPSAQGTHDEPVVEGYRWIGKSSTYAFPAPGEQREIIPALFVYGEDQPQCGWFAGIEFSGRTRITLERQATVSRPFSVSIQNRDPSPQESNRAENLRRLLFFSGPSPQDRTVRAISCGPGCARCLAIRSPGAIRNIRSR
jgi:hypothetical protein